MRHVLVTGAAGGIGLACARAFHELGDTVTGVDAREDALAEAMAPLGATALTADLSDPDCAEVLDRAPGPVDVLVNAAGIYPATSLADMTARVGCGTRCRTSTYARRCCSRERSPRAAGPPWW
jgi:3-oxoacyl-[acyl-carrier protein] reductase